LALRLGHPRHPQAGPIPSILADVPGRPRSLAVAIDPNSPSRPIAADLESPIIDNEMPAYRAVQPLAIMSFIAGAASVLSFTSPYFVLFGVLGLILGLLALRTIARLPEIYTGEKIANAGIGLGLLFSLSALTITFVQGWLVERDAAKFAREYVVVLRDKSFEDALFLETPPANRKGHDAQGFVEEMKKGSRNPGMFEEQTKSLAAMKNRLKGPSQTIEFHGIVGHNGQALDVYANALLVFKGPKSASYPEETQHAELVLHGTPLGSGRYDWWVEKIVFPLSPKNLGN
jgi:hypothetical protein